MTGPRPRDRARSFGPDELAGLPGANPEELAAETRLGRELEGLADRVTVRPSADFSDRVMAAIATEPVPAPAVAAGSALRRAALGGFLGSLRDSFRVAFGSGFPAVARAQALVVVLLVVAVAAGSGYATAGALGAFGDRASPSPVAPAPSPSPSPSTPPTATPSPLPSPTVPTPSPDGVLEPAETASADPGETDGHETERPDATSKPDDHGGSGGSSTPKPTDRSTPKPTATPHETEDDHHETPHPTETPDHHD